jgi:hypothetical protein
MNTLRQIFISLFNRGGQAAAARGLFERADAARGLSRGDAQELRSNALALLRVVR